MGAKWTGISCQWAYANTHTMAWEKEKENENVGLVGVLKIKFRTHADIFDWYQQFDIWLLWKLSNFPKINSMRSRARVYTYKWICVVIRFMTSFFHSFICPFPFATNCSLSELKTESIFYTCVYCIECWC